MYRQPAARRKHFQSCALGGYNKTMPRNHAASNAQVWISMRQEAKAAAEKEPLLVSFVYSTILNQKTLEAAVAFHLANKVNIYAYKAFVGRLVFSRFSLVGRSFSPLLFLCQPTFGCE